MDVDSQKAYDEMIQLLVAAGYFRARVSLYSPFDRIVGGMVWCILNCSVVIKVDLLFRRNLIIKQKITLSESIVTALIQMKCPQPIEPHQIHGMDLINIFPVVQWLVKNAMQFRDQTARAMREMALHYDKTTYHQAESPKALKIIQNNFNARSAVKRSLRQVDSARLRPLDLRLRLTLREYTAERFSRLNDTLEQRSTEEISQVDNLVQPLTSCTASVSTVTQLVCQQSDAIKAVSDEFGAKKAELEVLKTQGPANRRKRIENISREIEEFDGKIYTLKSRRDLCTEENKLLAEKITEFSSKNRTYQFEIEKLQETNKGVAALLSAQKEVDELNRQIKEFKSKCNEESEIITKETGHIQADLNEYSATSTQMQINVDNLRSSLAKRTRAVALLERKIDQQLSPEELNQYSIRFMELEDEMSTALRDTTQILLTKNTNATLLESIKNETCIMETIIRSIESGLKNASTRAFFVDELKRVAETVDSVYQKAVLGIETQTALKQDATKKFLALLEDDKNYRIVLKKFSEECARNSKLTAKLSGGRVN